MEKQRTIGLFVKKKRSRQHGVYEFRNNRLDVPEEFSDLSIKHRENEISQHIHTDMRGGIDYDSDSSSIFGYMPEDEYLKMWDNIDKRGMFRNGELCIDRVDFDSAETAEMNDLKFYNYGTFIKKKEEYRKIKEEERERIRWENQKKRQEAKEKREKEERERAERERIQQEENQREYERRMRIRLERERVVSQELHNNQDFQELLRILGWN